MSDRLSRLSLYSLNNLSKSIPRLSLLMVTAVLLAGCAGGPGASFSGPPPAASPTPTVNPGATPSPTPTPTPAATPAPTPDPNATNFLYLTDSSGLFEVNTRTGEVFGIPLPGFPGGLAAMPDGSRLYVAQAGAGTVAVLDTHTNSLITTVPVGQQPERVAITPDGRFAYVTNTQDGTVSVIETSENAVVKTIFTDSAPWAIAFSNDGASAYVGLLNFVGNTGGPNHEAALVIIDTATQTITKKLPAVLGDSMAASPTRHELYLVEADLDLAVLDTNTNQVVSRIPLDPTEQDGVAVSPDGQTIYVIQKGSIDIGPGDPSTVTPSVVYAIDADQRAVIARAQTEPGLAAISMAPDGSSVYLLADGTDFPGVITMDPKTLTFSPVDHIGDFPIQMALARH